MALHRVGFRFGEHVELEEIPVGEQRSGHNAIQTAAEVIMALAAVFALFTQSKDSRLAWALVSVIVLVFALMYGGRVRRFFRVRMFQARRDKIARAQHRELHGFVKQFSQFSNSGDSSNLRYIVFGALGNSPEKCAEVMPPDYMHDLCQFLVQDFERRSDNEREFLLWVQKMYGYIASYNKEYVIEPFRKMRMKRWLPTVFVSTGNQGKAPEAIGLVPEAVTWIESLAPMYRENTERQIEDFRERWVGFLDDVKKWVEKMNDTFGVKMPSYFERPQKL